MPGSGALAEDLVWLQEVMRDESDEFTHGPFKVIPLKGYRMPRKPSSASTKPPLSSLQVPEGALRKVFIRKDLKPVGSYDRDRALEAWSRGATPMFNDTITLACMRLRIAQPHDRHS